MLFMSAKSAPQRKRGSKSKKARRAERLLPEAVEHELKSGAHMLIGATLIIIACAIWIALASWSIHDPSINHITNRAPQNLLGHGGAIIADILFQFCGLAAILMIVPVLRWGWLIFSHLPIDNIKTRILTWPLSAALLAGALASFKAPHSWPLPNGLGGIIGDAVYGAGHNLASMALPLYSGKLAMAVLILWGIGSLFYSAHITARDVARLASFENGLAGTLAHSLGLLTSVITSVLGLRLIFAFFRRGLDTLFGMGSQEDERIDAMHKRHHLRASELAEEPITPPTHHEQEKPRSMMRGSVRDLYPEESRYETQDDSPPSLLRRLKGRNKKARDDYDDPYFDKQAEHDFEPQLDPHLINQNLQNNQRQDRIEPHFGPAFGAPHSFDAEQNMQDYSAQAHQAHYGSYDEEQFDTGYSEAEHYETGAHAAAAGQPRVTIQPNVKPTLKSKSRKTRPAQDSGAQYSDAHKGAHRGASAPAYHAAEREFILPDTRLLAEAQKTGGRRKGHDLTDDQLQENALYLEQVLKDFGVRGEMIDVHPGPVVTLYEFEPARGTKSARVIGLADDIARSMGAASARIAVIQGRNALGIELPNETRETVYLREVLEAPSFQNANHALTLALGKDIGGAPLNVDLGRMPHLLIAGTTGSGKSVGINAMILSLLYRLSPDECKMIMIDPKMLELSVYDGIPHLLTPVVTDPKKAVVALKWAVREMEERYKKMSKLGVRNIDGFNKQLAEAEAAGENLCRTVQTGYDRDTGEAIYEYEEMDYEPMPYIVVVVDEMADLMMVAGKEIEGAVQRLAQMARAAGIHLIAATQRPSVDVVTGTIKANFPTRISYQVTSKIDSRTILGEQGAEQLLGMGDMLYMAGGGRLTRIHAPFVSDDEVERVVHHLKTQGIPEYLDAITQEDEADEGAGPDGEDGQPASLYDQAVDIVLRDGKASTSYIQRRLSIGYNRAANLIEQMEEDGLISPPNKSGRREIYGPQDQDPHTY